MQPALLYIGIKAVIIQDKKLFLLLRSNEREAPFWDLPGGRMEARETFEQTLSRELQEELPGITNVSIGKLLTAYKKPQPLTDNNELVLLFFSIQADLSKVSISTEHTQKKWVSSEEFELLSEEVNPLFKEFFPYASSQ